MPIMRNPFRKQDENVKPAPLEQPVNPLGTPGGSAGNTKPIEIGKSEKEPAEYKLSEINDSGVYLPPSPPERKRSFWPTTTSRSTTSSTSTSTFSRRSKNNHRSLWDENQQFNISRESFDSYRRSFDISARSPIVRPSLDGCAYPGANGSSTSATSAVGAGARPRMSLDSRGPPSFVSAAGSGGGGGGGGGTGLVPPRMSLDGKGGGTAAGAPPTTSRASSSFQRPGTALPAETKEDEREEGLPAHTGGNSGGGGGKEGSSAAAGGFEDVDIGAASSSSTAPAPAQPAPPQQQQKKRGLFARITDSATPSSFSSSSSSSNDHSASTTSTSFSPGAGGAADSGSGGGGGGGGGRTSWIPFTSGRKRGQSQGAGAELGSLVPAAGPVKREGTPKAEGLLRRERGEALQGLGQARGGAEAEGDAAAAAAAEEEEEDKERRRRGEVGGEREGAVPPPREEMRELSLGGGRQGEEPGADADAEAGAPSLPGRVVDAGEMGQPSTKGGRGEEERAASASRPQ